MVGSEGVVSGASWPSSPVVSVVDSTGSSSSLDTSGSCEESTFSEEKMSENIK